MYKNNNYYEGNCIIPQGVRKYTVDRGGWGCRYGGEKNVNEYFKSNFLEKNNNYIIYIYIQGPLVITTPHSKKIIFIYLRKKCGLYML